MKYAVVVTNPLAAVVDVAWLEGELTRLTIAPSAGDIARLADALSAFVLALHPADVYATTVAAVCRAATSEERSVADAGQRLLFSAIAEPLGDSFEPRAARLYDELFADVIDYCRRLQVAADVDACLTRAGIGDRAALLRRKAFAGGRTMAPRTRGQVRKVLVLSRVTIGADVAVTGVVLQKLARLYPDAELCLVGSSAPDLVSAGTRVRGISHRYERRGNLVSRLTSWVDLVETCQRELGGLDTDQCLVVDPDSRLTQLGLLPLVDAAVPSAFFESRSYRASGVQTISGLTAHWLDATFGSDDAGADLSPLATPAPEDAAWAESMIGQVGRRDGTRLVGVNLGVGGNPRKRLSDAFELDLLRSLLRAGDTVILDFGTRRRIARRAACGGRHFGRGAHRRRSGTAALDVSRRARSFHGTPGAHRLLHRLRLGFPAPCGSPGCAGGGRLRRPAQRDVLAPMATVIGAHGARARRALVDGRDRSRGTRSGSVPRPAVLIDTPETAPGSGPTGVAFLHPGSL
jgi:hypothetical protein